MLWNVRTLGLLLVVTQGSFILCLELRNSSLNPCRNCALDSQSKITAKIRQLERDSKELFDCYLTHQGFSHDLHQHCYKTVTWFPTGNITEQPTVTRLQELHRTMERMSDALYHIQMQQRALNKPDAILLSELRRASVSAKALLSNIRCGLCLLGTVTSPTSRTVPRRHATRSAFQLKIEGCKVLWNYSRFLEALVQGSERKEQQAGNNKRRKRKSPKRKQA